MALLTTLVVSKFQWVTSAVNPVDGSTIKTATTGAEVCFVFSCAAVWFGMINSVRELVKERTIWRRESLAGAHVQAYLASKLVVLGLLAAAQTLSMTLVVGVTLHFGVQSYFGAPAAGFFISMLLANFSGIAIGLLISAVAPSSDRAMSLVPYLLLAQLILCGVLFPLHALKVVSWIIPARWADYSLGGAMGLYQAHVGASGTTYAGGYAALLGSWLLLVALVGVGVAITARILSRRAGMDGGMSTHGTATPLGIDLGTTMSVVARLDSVGEAIVLPNADGSPTTPSVVLFEEHQAVVGQSAKDAIATEPEMVVQLAKRHMGSDSDLRLQPRPVPRRARVRPRAPQAAPRRADARRRLAIRGDHGAGVLQRGDAARDQARRRPRGRRRDRPALRADRGGDRVRLRPSPGPVGQRRRRPRWRHVRRDRDALRGRRAHRARDGG